MIDSFHAVAELQLETGRLSYEKCDLQEALRLLFESKQIFETLNLSPKQRNCLLWIARVFVEVGQPDKAEESLRQAIAIDEKFGNEPNLATDYNNLSLIYKARGELTQAEEWLRKAIAIAERLDDRPKLRSRYETYSALLRELGREEEARQYAEKAQEIQAALARK